MLSALNRPAMHSLMKKLSTLFALVTVTLALTGCKSGTTEKTASPPVSKAPVQTASHHDGLACSKCVCSHFEPELAAASTCRMCGHSRADHTRPETSPVTR